MLCRNILPLSHSFPNHTSIQQHSTPPSQWQTRSPKLIKPLSNPHSIPNIRGKPLTTRALLGGAGSVLEAAGVLATVVTVHECGHFMAAYFQNIKVSNFSIGFGPALARFNIKEVECSIRAIPLGGFVAFPDVPLDDTRILRNRPAAERVLVAIAGVAANVVFAYLILFTQATTIGLAEREFGDGVLVPQVFTPSAAARAGLKPRDIVLSVDDYKFKSIADIVEFIKSSPGKEMDFLVQRRVSESTDFVNVRVTADVADDGTGKIGVQLAPNVSIVMVRPANVLDAFGKAGGEVVRLTRGVVEDLKTLVFEFKKTAGKVSGPVAIVAVGAQVAQSGSEGFFQFAAILNLNLAVVNILPLPALDGGQLAFIALESLRGGKRLPDHVEKGIMSSGLALVLMVGVFLMVRDTLNLDFVREML